MYMHNCCTIKSQKRLLVLVITQLVSLTLNMYGNQGNICLITHLRSFLACLVPFCDQELSGILLYSDAADVLCLNQELSFTIFFMKV